MRDLNGNQYRGLRRVQIPPNVGLQAAVTAWPLPALIGAFCAVGGISHLPILGILSGLTILDRYQYVLSTVAITLLVVVGCRSRMATTRLRSDGRLEPVGLGLIFFVAAGLISCVFATYRTRPYHSIEMWQQFLMSCSIIVLYFVYRVLVRFGDGRRFFITGVDLVGLVSIGSILAHMLGIATGEAMESRQFGVLGDAVAWLLSALCVVYFERRSWLTFAVTVALLIATGSRAPALFAVAGMILASVLRPSEQISGMLKRLATASLLIVGLYLVPKAAPALAQRIRETDLLYNDRVETARFGLQLFSESPWIGLGFNAQPHYFAERLSGAGSKFMILSTSSSTPVQVLADSGLLGFVPLTVALLFLLLASYRVARTPAHATPPGAERKFFHTTRGMACWLMPFILLNNFVAYHNPLSMVGVIFFSAAGAVVALDATLRRAKRESTMRARSAKWPPVGARS